MTGLDITLLLLVGFVIGFAVGSNTRGALVRSLVEKSADLTETVTRLQEDNHALWSAQYERKRDKVPS